MQSQKRDVKFFVLHGFGGGTYEVEPLVERLRKSGYEVFAPILKGHQGSSSKMAKTTYREWIESAEIHLAQFTDNSENVIFIGFSMGGLIGFNLSQDKKFKAIVTINTPIFFWNIPQVFRNLMEDIKNMRTENIRRYIRAKKNSPIRSMIQFLIMLGKTKSKLDDVHSPILVVQALDDDTVRLKSAEYILNNVSSEDKQAFYVDRGGHLVLLSPKGDRVIEKILNWEALS
ncbi:alpha/beta hydrolase [Alkalibacter mobilis]|uniref:alpha/beta hydrolase n=1 Tax=Alkalibacter mobilis TaxID=2787712 RepID=UPI00189DD55C|nr:alpha/beta fold hydrolase [Alkalibacter mobilis]MBF7097019.1 alpha/beta fold hydrolase [Alkalibacter mobilis]